jgi:hypothetical protein
MKHLSGSIQRRARVVPAYEDRQACKEERFS